MSMYMNMTCMYMWTLFWSRSGHAHAVCTTRHRISHLSGAARGGGSRHAASHPMPCTRAFASRPFVSRPFASRPLASHAAPTDPVVPRDSVCCADPRCDAAHAARRCLCIRDRARAPLGVFARPSVHSLAGRWQGCPRLLRICLRVWRPRALPRADPRDGAAAALADRDGCDLRHHGASVLAVRAAWVLRIRRLLTGQHQSQLPRQRGKHTLHRRAGRTGALAHATPPTARMRGLHIRFRHGALQSALGI